MSKDPDTLRIATQNEVSLALEVQTRFQTLTVNWRKIRREQLKIPSSLKPEVSCWDRMVHRFEGGDFRCSDSEFKGLTVFAEWVYDTNCIMRGQQPGDLRKHLEAYQNATEG